MLINVCFDLHFSVISCDNVAKDDVAQYAKEFDEYVYEPTKNKNMLTVKKEIDVLDVNTLVKWLNMSYPKLNAKIVTEKLQISSMDESLPTINI